MAEIKTIDELDARGKRVLVRVDFNVPVKDGAVTDDTRIRAALPTIQKLVDDGARVILMSHLGRPAGEGFEESFTLRPAAQKLSELMGKPVVFATDTVGDDARAKAASLRDGDVLVVENLRFDKREKKNDPAFCEELAALGEAYVNDAFGTAHRAHASTAGVAALLPAYAGYLMQREVATLSGMLEEPRRPFTAILGGSKVSDKIKVIDALMDKCDTLIIGGGMCFTFLLAQGKAVGTSLKEEDWVERAAAMIAKAEERGVQLLLPVDVVCADRFAEDAETLTVSVDGIPGDMMGLDIGPETAKLYADAVAQAKTVFWNGPMGVFEMKAFEAGTKAVAEAVVLTQEISNQYDKETWGEDVDIVICPPYVDLKPAKTVLDFDKTKVAVNAQNVYWEPSGAYTGEISVPMIKEIGCAGSIVGHSERRELFGETNEDVNRKVKALVEAGLYAIVCVGESLAVRDEGTTEEFVCAQVRAAFAGVDAADAQRCVVAYEPIWAIGTGRTATPEQAEAVCAAIRATLADLYGAEVAEEMRVLYGGSMNPGNVEGLMAQPNIDGGLIGGASLKAASFVQLINACL